MSTVAALLLLLVAGVSAQTNGQPPSLADVGDPRIINYQDWSLQCLPASGSAPETCAMVHEVVLSSGKRLLALQVTETATVGRSDGPALVAVLSLPLGVYLPTGVSLLIDDKPPMKLEFERCDRGGCYAGVIMGEALSNALMKGVESTVRFNNLDGRTISAKLSLKGFTAARAALIAELED